MRNTTPGTACTPSWRTTGRRNGASKKAMGWDRSSCLQYYIYIYSDEYIYIYLYMCVCESWMLLYKIYKSCMWLYISWVCQHPQGRPSRRTGATWTSRTARHRRHLVRVWVQIMWYNGMNLQLCNIYYNDIWSCKAGSSWLTWTVNGHRVDWR